jgi:Putative auto-transporter adhesin, head GIN domain
MRHRSLFWPFILIATGLVWLLIQLNYIPLENLWALAYIWPFFLMAVGVGLILRSRWPVLRMIVSGLIVLGMVLSIVFAPQLGWNKAPAWNFINLGGFTGSVRGSGTVISQTRDVADFNTIEINYPVELTVQQSDSTSLTVEAEDNLLPQLATRVSGTTLYIENSQPDWTKRVNPTRPVKIALTIKNLQRVDFPSAGTLRVGKFQTDRLEISISGAGTVNLSDLTTQSLSVNLSGAGTITAAGSATTLSLDISGVGSFHGDDLASQTADVNISGAGSATVWVKSSLSASISGTGSVRYYGSPSVQRQISGLGSVSSLGNK